MNNLRTLGAGALCAVLLCPVSVFAEDIIVKSGGDFQAALNRAVPGDTIVLEAAGRYVGEFRVPAKPFGPVITVKSSATLPNRRLEDSDQPLLATLAPGVSAPALVVEKTANWRFEGINFEPHAAWVSGEAVVVQDSSAITFDRVRIAAPPTGVRRGLRFNGQALTLTRSRITGFWYLGQDSQAVCAYDGAGPYTITDNYLEAASENVMFGGADSTSPDRLPADILIEGNHFSKPLAWKGQKRGVKNLFELKAAKRVKVLRNLFENNWVDAQGGSAIVITPRNQDGKAAWTVVSDVLFEGNIVRNTPTIFNIIGFDNNGASLQTTNITIRHNLLLGTGGRMGTFCEEIGVLTLDHNTYLSPQTVESSLMELCAESDIDLPDGTTRRATYAVQTFSVTNSLMQANKYGVRSSKALQGTPTLEAMTKGYTWTHNVLAGGGGTYPAVTTMLPVDQYAAQFTPEYLLVAGSPFKAKASDGTDLGWGGPSVVTLPTPEPPPVEPPPPVEGPGEPQPVQDTVAPQITSFTVTKTSGTRYRATVLADDDHGVFTVRLYVDDGYRATMTEPSSGTTYTEYLKITKKGASKVKVVVTDASGNAATREVDVTR